MINMLIYFAHDFYQKATGDFALQCFFDKWNQHKWAKPSSMGMVIRRSSIYLLNQRRMRGLSSNLSRLFMKKLVLRHRRFRSSFQMIWLVVYFLHPCQISAWRTGVFIGLAQENSIKQVHQEKTPRNQWSNLSVNHSYTVIPLIFTRNLRYNWLSSLGLPGIR